MECVNLFVQTDIEIGDEVEFSDESGRRTVGATRAINEMRRIGGKVVTTDAWFEFYCIRELSDGESIGRWVTRGEITRAHKRTGCGCPPDKTEEKAAT